MYFYVSQREELARAGNCTLTEDQLLNDTLAYLADAIKFGEARVASAKESTADDDADDDYESDADADGEDDSEESGIGTSTTAAATSSTSTATTTTSSTASTATPDDAGDLVDTPDSTSVGDIQADGTENPLSLCFFAQLCRWADTAGRMGVDVELMGELYSHVSYLRKGAWSASAAIVADGFARGATMRSRLQKKESATRGGRFMNDFERLVCAHSYVVADAVFRFHHAMQNYTSGAASLAEATVLQCSPNKQPNVGSFYDKPSATLPARCFAVGARRLLCAPYRLHKLYDSARVRQVDGCEEWFGGAATAGGLWQDVKPPTSEVLETLATGIQQTVAALNKPGVVAELHKPDMLADLCDCATAAAALLLEEAASLREYVPAVSLVELELVGIEVDAPDEPLSTHKVAAAQLRKLSDMAAVVVGSYKYR